MKTIYKYKVPLIDTLSLELPADSKILKFDQQEGEPFLWVLVDSGNKTVTRNFKLYGTGHRYNEHDDSLSYIGTAVGIFVWHLFEVLPEKNINHPLTQKIENDKMVISIGLDILIHAVTHGPRWDSVIEITNKEGFSKDILHALEFSDEDGTKAIHKILDRAAEEALEFSEHYKNKARK